MSELRFVNISLAMVSEPFALSSFPIKKIQGELQSLGCFESRIARMYSGSPHDEAVMRLFREEKL